MYKHVHVYKRGGIPGTELACQLYLPTTARSRYPYTKTKKDLPVVHNGEGFPNAIVPNLDIFRQHTLICLKRRCCCCWADSLSNLTPAGRLLLGTWQFRSSICIMYTTGILYSIRGYSPTCQSVGAAQSAERKKQTGNDEHIRTQQKLSQISCVALSVGDRFG